MKTLGKTILAIVLAIILFGAGCAVGYFYKASTQPTLTASTVESQISGCSDLATSKLDYRGLVHYSAGDIPLINKKEFTMVYEAQVKAGVDLSKAQVTITGKHITVSLPQATVQSTTIEPDSLMFYDSTWSLFNWENRSDTTEALKLAADDADKKVDQTSLISTANDNAVDVVSNLLAPFTDESQGYTLDIHQA